jgi:P27 family predicted phage terminase small subunit
MQPESFWRSTVSQAVDYVSDRPRVERWIRWLDEWERTYRKLRKADLVTTGSMGQQRLNPLARYLALCEDAVQKAEHDLGLSPMARLKLGITLGQARMTMAEFRAGLLPEVEEVPADVWAEWTGQPVRKDEVIDLAQLGD